MEQWNWAQWAVAIALVLRPFAHAAQEGKPRRPTSVGDGTASALLWFVMLYFGGLWG